MAALYGTSIEPVEVSFLAAGETENIVFDAGAQSNRALYVHVAWRDRGNDISGVTYNGVSLASLLAKTTETSTSVRLFRLVAPASGSNNLAVTMGAGSNSSVAMISIWVAYNVDQVTPDDAVQTAQGTSTSASVASAVSVSSATGDRVVFFHALRDTVAESTATPTGYTERGDNAVTGAGMCAECGDADGDTSITGTATWNNGAYATEWMAVGVNVNASSARSFILVRPA